MINEDLLLQIRKPGQYIGREWNIARKDFDGQEVKFALCFPDLYEVGMSNLGIRILYELLNSQEGIGCERFFACDSDFEQSLRQHQRPFCSLESDRRLRDFDWVGFSLSYELSYTNVLNMLDLGAIPLRASQRDHTFPLVIGGGPCMMNPEPMSDFFDLLVIGEAEEALLEIMAVYKKEKARYRSGSLAKQELLTMLAQIEGVYVPALYRPEYDAQSRLAAFVPLSGSAPSCIRKRFIQDLEHSLFPEKWLVPQVSIVHDRVTLEIMRGCPNRCRFCQARALYFPFRRRQRATVEQLAERLYAATGYEEFSLAGLSVSDYPEIEQLVSSLISNFKKRAVGVSLPSIKPKIIVERLSPLIASIKKTGLTFAPEAADKRLREALGKDFDTDDFLSVMEKAYGVGYQHVKLYFMIGLPSEEKSDLDKIVEMAVTVSELRRKVVRQAAQVNLSINTLIPKPHTAFQWFGVADRATIQDKQSYLLSRVRSRKLKVDFHDRNMSYLEAILCRGDRRLGAVIEEAFHRGARFDGWQNRFNLQIWEEAFKQAGLDPQLFLKPKERTELLPWDFIDVGVRKDFLVREAEEIEKAVASRGA